MQINVRENIRGNPESRIQRHWQHWARTTQDEDGNKTLQDKNNKCSDKCN